MADCPDQEHIPAWYRKHILRHFHLPSGHLLALWKINYWYVYVYPSTEIDLGGEKFYKGTSKREAATIYEAMKQSLGGEG